MGSEDVERVMTKAAQRRGRQPPPLEVVSFSQRRKPIKAGIQPQESTEPLTPEEQRKEFNLKKARFEVSQLALKSLREPGSRAEAKQALAIALGARPPKKKGMNYKELKEQRFSAKQQLEHAEKLQGLGKILKKTGRKTTSGKTLGRPSKPSSTPKAPHRKLSKGILGQYGKVSKGKMKAAMKKSIKDGKKSG